jgi:hypothetical protein
MRKAADRDLKGGRSTTSRTSSAPDVSSTVTSSASTLVGVVLDQTS